MTKGTIIMYNFESQFLLNRGAVASESAEYFAPERRQISHYGNML